MSAERELEQLSRGESMTLLASVAVGRLVFTHHALPAVRPVNHVIDDDTIVIGLTPGSALAESAGADGVVVAYEADLLDEANQAGWSVVVVGVARLQRDPDAVHRYREIVRPWLSGATADILAIKCEIVTGYLISEGEVRTGEMARVPE